MHNCVQIVTFLAYKFIGLVFVKQYHWFVSGHVVVIYPGPKNHVTPSFPPQVQLLPRGRRSLDVSDGNARPEIDDEYNPSGFDFGTNARFVHWSKVWCKVSNIMVFWDCQELYYIKFSIIRKVFMSFKTKIMIYYIMFSMFSVLYLFFSVIPPPQWPVNNITEEEAQQFCTFGITGSQSYSACSQDLESVTHLVDKCVLDIQVITKSWSC